MSEKTIVLWCNHPEDLEKMKNLLAKMDRKALVVNSYEELHSTLKKNMPAIAILDYQTSEGNGFEVARKLRMDPETRGISAIIKIRLAEDQVEEVAEQGVNDYLFSPFPEKEFNKLIEKHESIEARRPLQCIVQFQTGDTWHVGKTLNLSSTGLLLQSPIPLALKSILTLQIFLPNHAKPLSLKGKVKRLAHERITYLPCYGLEFVEVPPTIQDLLRKLTQKS